MIELIGLISFLFIVYNYTDLGLFFKSRIDKFLINKEVSGKWFYGKIRYALQCPLCFCFWTTLIFSLDNLKISSIFIVVTSATLSKLYGAIK